MGGWKSVIRKPGGLLFTWLFHGVSLSSLFSTVAGPLHGDLGLSKHKGELAKLLSGLGLDEALPTNSAFIGLIIS